jgi:hypothetical protein
LFVARQLAELSAKALARQFCHLENMNDISAMAFGFGRGS